MGPLFDHPVRTRWMRFVTATTFAGALLIGGLVDTPAVLVVTRRRAVTAELKGFVDRNVVAQAISDAR